MNVMGLLLSYLEFGSLSSTAPSLADSGLLTLAHVDGIYLELATSKVQD